MLTHKKGQSATEAAVLISFLTFFLIITLASVADDLVHATDDNYRSQLLDFADVIEQEAMIAFGSENGYFHAFTLPPTVNGQPYVLSIVNSTSLMGVGDKGNITIVSVASKMLPLNITKVLPRDVRGNLVRGTNTVSKQDQIVIFIPLALTAAEQAACISTCSGIVSREQCCDYGYASCCT